MSPNQQQLKSNISSMNVVNENTFLMTGESSPIDSQHDRSKNKSLTVIIVGVMCFLGLILYYTTGSSSSNSFNMLSSSSTIGESDSELQCKDLLVGVFDETCIFAKGSATAFDDAEGIVNYKALSFLTSGIDNDNNERELDEYTKLLSQGDGNKIIKFLSHGHIVDTNGDEIPTSISNCVGDIHYSYEYEGGDDEGDVDEGDGGDNVDNVDENNETTDENETTPAESSSSQSYKTIDMKYSFNTLDGGKTIYLVSDTGTCMLTKLHGKKCKKTLKSILKAHKKIGGHKISRRILPNDLC